MPKSKRRTQSKGLALITGASAGIGQATALHLAREGYDLVICARRRNRLQSIGEQIESTGRKCHVLSFDISRESEVAATFKKNSSILKNVKVLVNNAGLARGVEKIQEGRLEDWKEMWDTNVHGLMHVTRLLLPALIESRGHIVNVGSVAGRWVYPGGGVYCATKFAVRALSEGLRFDLMGTNVRVTNIEPGAAETEFSLVRLRDRDKAAAVYEGYKPLVAEDIAECIVWALARPNHVNVQEMVVFPTAQAAVGYIHKAPGSGRN